LETAQKEERGLDRPENAKDSLAGLGDMFNESPPLISQTGGFLNYDSKRLVLWNDADQFIN